VTPDALTRAFMMAFAFRLSGLRQIAERLGRTLGTRNFSSLCPALSRPGTLRYVQGLIRGLEGSHRPGRDALAALDSMAVTLPRTQRHRCPKFNDKTAGGGILWVFMIHASAACCPVRVLKVIPGAWHDSRQMLGVKLQSRGPVYLADRGFFAFDLIAQWLGQGVRFILRARADATWTEVARISGPRPCGKGWLWTDARVRLGAAQSRLHPEVRLIHARIGATDLRLVSSEMEWTAEQILDAYRKRERIEQFHRLLKESIGLAHLYSFSLSGIAFLIHAALLLALLLFLSEPEASGEVIALLRKALKSLRAGLGLDFIWKRNTIAARRAKSTCQNP
jgi:hypothetical protein